ncbi:hypothetical protein ILUMI_11834 [Ignelater luminosus]|uniref:Single domain-containing protein n=1 Tax=Ignelater luminosus TaxID=2038154 RepID=A0A8K0D1F6_IGNLU|nr:hypothetical protein ILUMI_11834 [Ignelater luminosus]
MNYIKLIAFMLLTLCYFHNAKGDTLGGVSPEMWNKKCKTHFEKHGDKAVNIPIYIDGYCERYNCQKYGYEMYGVTTDECKKFKTIPSKCKIVPNKPNEPYPYCCPKLICE